jgi:TRAP-type uncharacterized transport system substrate-binding protein
MWDSHWRPLITTALAIGLALATLYAAYQALDPLPPRHFTIAAGLRGSQYNNFAQQYARILAGHGVALEVRDSGNTVENLDLLRDEAAGVQAALTTFGFTRSEDAQALYSLGGIFDAAIFIFYRGAGRIDRFAEFRGKRVSIGPSGSALRSLMSEVLHADGMEGSTELFDFDYAEALDALIAGKIDIAIFPSPLDGPLLQRALNAPDLRLMNVAQAEAVAKLIPGLKHLVMWRGLISLGRDIPSSDVNLLAFRSRVLVRSNLHPALQYLLLEAMREVHWAPGPFNRLGEFPAEQPNDLALSPTAQAFYRSGPSFWQRSTAFWLTSLLNRIMFFVIPIIVLLIPIVGFVPTFYRWLHIRPIHRLHRALGELEDYLAEEDAKRSMSQSRLAEIERAVRSLKVSRNFEVDLHRLKVHLRMVQEDVARMAGETLESQKTERH